MSALTSLLARDGVVSVRTIEQALQQQVIRGGDVETILLEMGAIAENVLAGYQAALHERRGATREQVMGVPPEVIALVPAEVAIERSLVPLALEGRRLVVAVREPLSDEARGQLEFLLGHEFVERIACEPRLMAALAHHYGAPIAPRMARLIGKLLGRDPGVLPEADIEIGRLSGHAIEIPTKRTRPSRRFLLEPAPPEEEPKVARAEPELQPETQPETHPELLPELQPETQPETQPEMQPELQPETQPEMQPEMLPEAQPAPEPEPVSEPGRVSAPEPVSEPAPVARKRPPEDRWSVPAPPVDAPVRPRRRPVPQSSLRLMRGPLTLAAGERALKRATDRDQILEVFFSYARQFFDFTALFVVTDDRLDGREVYGPGMDNDAVRAISLGITSPSALSEVKRSLSPQVRRLDSGASDRELLVALRRPLGDALLMPIAIRRRVVLMLYGDRGGERFDLGAMMELVRFGPRVVETLEQLILRKKRTGYHDEKLEDRPSLKQAARAAVAYAGRARAGRHAWRREHGAAIPPPAPPAPTLEAMPAQPELEPEPPHEPPREPPHEPPHEPQHGAPPVAPPEARRQPRPAPESLPPPHPPGAPPKAVLGIPRSAPPPPPSIELPAVVEAPPPRPSEPPKLEVVASDDDDEPELVESDEPELELSSDDEQWEEGAQDEPELVLDAGDDGEPELFEEPGEPPPPSLASPRQKPAGTYRLRGGAVDIVAEGDRHLHGEGPLRAEVVHIPAPRPARDQDAETRSVIVDMGEQVHAQVEDLLHAQDDRQRDELISGLRAFGEAALPVLVQAFPGPLSFERHQSRRRLPAGRDVSPIARALVAFGERAVPYVASLLTSASSDTRYYASLVAAELVHPGLLEVVAERIHDEDDDTRKIACLLLPRFRGMSGFDEILAVIRRTARLRGKHLERRHHAVDALAALRDASSAESLAELLREDDPELVRRAHRALVLITGTDEGTSPRKWLAWLKRHGGRHRIEWLIEALTHPDEPVRAAAGDELKRLTQEYYGFHAGSPRRDRELVQQRYRRWWEKDGHKRFGL